MSIEPFRVSVGARAAGQALFEQAQALNPTEKDQTSVSIAVQILAAALAADGRVKSSLILLGIADALGVSAAKVQPDLLDGALMVEILSETTRRSFAEGRELALSIRQAT